MSEAAGTNKKQIITLKSIATLIAETQKLSKVRFELRGQTYELEIRSLPSVEMDAANKIQEAVVPPKVTKQTPTGLGGKMETNSDFNYEDADFRARFAQAALERQAFILEKGLPDFTITGETLAEKAAWLKSQLPSSVLRALEAQIVEISDGALTVIQQADFFSESVSSGAPS